MMATAMLATIATLSVIAFQQTRELFTDSTPLADFLPQLKPEVTPQQQPEPTPQPGTRPRIRHCCKNCLGAYNSPCSSASTPWESYS
jgi:hypothetical protein